MCWTCSVGNSAIENVLLFIIIIITHSTSQHSTTWWLGLELSTNSPCRQYDKVNQVLTTPPAILSLFLEMISMKSCAEFRQCRNNGSFVASAASICLSKYLWTVKTQMRYSRDLLLFFCLCHVTYMHMYIYILLTGPGMGSVCGVVDFYRYAASILHELWLFLHAEKSL